VSLHEHAPQSKKALRYANKTIFNYLNTTKVVKMSKLAGGPTQDEVMAVSLFKLGLRTTDTVLEIGCGTGKVSLAIARNAANVFSIDRRPEAVTMAKELTRNARVQNAEFVCTEASEYLTGNRVYDCAFVGGTKNVTELLPDLAGKVRRTIVINAVLVQTLAETVTALQDLGLFQEVVHLQVSRSHPIAGSLMFKPLDPVYVIVGRGTAC
jgi:cobalt-precorrin-6B (C15)-methyltransferase